MRPVVAPTSRHATDTADLTGATSVVGLLSMTLLPARRPDLRRGRGHNRTENLADPAVAPLGPHCGLPNPWMEIPAPGGSRHPLCLKTSKRGVKGLETTLACKVTERALFSAIRAWPAANRRIRNRQFARLLLQFAAAGSYGR